MRVPSAGEHNDRWAYTVLGFLAGVFLTFYALEGLGMLAPVS